MSELKEYPYYENLYDEITVTKCRDLIQAVKDDEISKDKPGKRKFRSNSYEFYVSFVMIDRALSKTKSIDEWIERDKKRDRFLNSINEPKIKCNKCSSLMIMKDKMLKIGINEEKDRVLFIYKCDDCNKSRMIHNDGEEVIVNKPKCNKCNVELEKEYTNINNNLYSIEYKCDKCNYIKKEEIDLSIKEKEVDLNYESDKTKFCISVEEANKRQLGIERMYEEISDIVNGKDPKSIAKKEEEKKYRPIKNIKMLSHKELEVKLGKVLNKEGYTDFNLTNPEVGDDIKVYFSVFDSNGETNTVKSNTKLRKLIKDFIEKTNWYFADSGRFENRLGIVKGRLKGVDNKDRLLKLIIKDK